MSEYQTPKKAPKALSPQPTPEEHVARLSAAHKIVEKATALYALEAKRAGLQSQLEGTNAGINGIYGDAEEAIENLQRAFSPPASPVKTEAPWLSTPTHSARAVSSAATAPATPTRPRPHISAASPRASPRTNAPHASPQPNTAGYYVLFHGRNSHTGVFTGYTSYLRGVTQQYSHVLYKKFNTLDKANGVFAEALGSGLLDKLNAVPAMGEAYVVVEGACPGVYMDRIKLMSVGLQWRGGLIERFSNEEAAYSYYTNVDSAGKTVFLDPEEDARYNLEDVLGEDISPDDF